MRTRCRGGFSSDEGISVLEVVLAAFVLFFVLTAVLGLVGSSTSMSVDARQRTALVNVVSRHMEWVRSLSWDQLNMAGTEEGVVPVTKTYTESGFTITITTEITQGEGELKEVRVTALATRDGYRSMSSSSYQSIWNHEKGIVIVSDDDELAPVIEFRSATPAEMTTVYLDRVIDGSKLYVDADVTANEGAVVADWKYEVDTGAGSTVLLCDIHTVTTEVDLEPHLAHWTPNEQYDSKKFEWDTSQIAPSSLLDGVRTVTITAVDSEGRVAYVKRKFFLDNFAPAAPTGATAVVQTDAAVSLSWNASKDGSDYARRYRVSWAKYESNGSLGPEYHTGDDAISTPGYTLATEAFSRYTASVEAGSVRFWSASTDFGPASFVTRPRLDGTSRTVTTPAGGNKVTYTTTVDLAVTPPTFATSGVRYDLYRGTSPTNLEGATLVAADTIPTFHETITKTGKSWITPDPYYYQYKITYTPTGSTQSTVIWSNVAGPINVTDAVLPMEQIW